MPRSFQRLRTVARGFTNQSASENFSRGVGGERGGGGDCPARAWSRVPPPARPRGRGRRGPARGPARARRGGSGGGAGGGGGRGRGRRAGGGAGRRGAFEGDAHSSHTKPPP